MATMGSSQTDEIDPDYEQAFPARLHYLLDVLEKDGLGHVCSFQSHGRAFVVRDKAAFVKDILPKWFRQSRWASFQRQLNHYEFQRITTGPDQGAYYHPHFLRGSEHRDRCRFIRRIKVKGTGPRKPSSPATEPNFYKHPPLGLHPNRSSDSLSEGTLSPTPSHDRTKSPAVGMRGAALVTPRVSELDIASMESNVAHHRRLAQDVWDPGHPRPAPWMTTRTAHPPPAAWEAAAALGAYPRSLNSLLLSGAVAATASVAGCAPPHPLLSKLRASRYLLAAATAGAMAASTSRPKPPADLVAPFRPMLAGPHPSRPQVPRSGLRIPSNPGLVVFGPAAPST